MVGQPPGCFYEEIMDSLGWSNGVHCGLKSGICAEGLLDARQDFYYCEPGIHGQPYD